MLLAGIAVLIGLLLLVWSADRFVDGAAATAQHFKVPPLLIGIVVIGFGTSAPEIVVSAISATQGNPGLALGNAYGSNIANIALVLGVTALISPVLVHSTILRKELPLLLGITLLAAYQVWDGEISRLDAIILLLVFFLIMGWTIKRGLSKGANSLALEVEQDLGNQNLTLKLASLWLVVGLLVLVASSRLLVWGAVEVAQGFGISDLIIGLTVVAIGTSLPELASSVVAARKGEHDMALGNILGSNLFNTLAVVGIAGSIHPLTFGPEVFLRDASVMLLLTLALFVLGYGYKKRQGRINRLAGGFLLACYVAYTLYLLSSI
ncbi:calcium/sodium antiporter [Marinospirillum insulare]|uniref:Sodium:calcium antiporter n=1 Tax=Marinospirillum insulare TaxID=217169 RepID=A0ABQ6A2Y0_9GAMM|nr:calcium/sodium antiporter [Marinospirillum insulare]GLR64578.1 sodium:calcium antiporter [Marinospirillum insulare]